MFECFCSSFFMLISIPQAFVHIFCKYKTPQTLHQAATGQPNPISTTFFNYLNLFDSLLKSFAFKFHFCWESKLISITYCYWSLNWNSILESKAHFKFKYNLKFAIDPSWDLNLNSILNSDSSFGSSLGSKLQLKFQMG